MNKLDLKISGNKNIDPIILLDNKQIKFKKNKYGNYLYQLETDKEELELEIFNLNELESPFWLLTSIIFFIISIFGIFDLRNNKKCPTLKYKGKIKINNESSLNLIFNPFSNNSKAFNYEGNCLLDDNETNVYYTDLKLKKRLKILKITKIILFLVFILSIVLFFII